ncbi:MULTISPECIES: zinc ribbon domain-containing protein [Haloferax]|uniref:ACP synthase n=1 Tax=Haloferax marinum TaxID=2666143 RepID=A0A6A8G9X9_9EURY|nr:MULTISPECIES: zinc ribbon domain-containing protein [Haloferax]KAB1191126.1 ACP synthase [Haloferax sp. CBA1150]MRW98009.1 ACP synthase [Haloferax marinum]
MNEIAGVGAYVPRLYLPADAYREAWGKSGAAGVERVAIPDADEDTLTMAVEAGWRALAAADVDPLEVEHLAFATTTPPADEEESTVRLASLLGIPKAVSTRQYGGGTSAGAAALAATLDTTGPALVVVSESPEGTPESDEGAGAGAGAVALVLDEDGPLVVDGVGEFGDPYPGTRFRRRGHSETESIGITQYERDAYTSAIGGAVDVLGTTVSDVDAVALTSPDGKLPYRAARTLGVSTAQIASGTVVSQTGDTGAAGPFLGLASALEDGASSVLLVGYGGGAGATALSLSADGDVPTRLALDGDTELSYAEALRRRGTITGEEPEGGGAYVSVPTWRQTIPQRHRLVAGRCRDCEMLSFPPEGACAACGSLGGYEAISLAGEGTVEAATRIGQGGAPPEFVEQQQRSGSFAVAVVAFDGPEGDETVSIPAQVVQSPVGTPTIGDRVEAVPRRIYEQEGVVRYGFKVIPTAAER